MRSSMHHLLVQGFYLWSCWLLCFWMDLVVVAAVESNGELFLYDNPESRPVIEYHGPDKGDFTISKNPRIVNLYGVFCGACRDFMDEYIELAKKVQATSGAKDVEFYALSCVAFPKVCQAPQYKVEGYPSLIAFTKEDGSERGGKTLQLKPSYTVNEILLALGKPLVKEVATKASETTRKLNEEGDAENDADDTETVSPKDTAEASSAPNDGDEPYDKMDTKEEEEKDGNQSQILTESPQNVSESKLDDGTTEEEEEGEEEGEGSSSDAIAKDPKSEDFNEEDHGQDEPNGSKLGETKPDIITAPMAKAKAHLFDESAARAFDLKFQQDMKQWRESIKERKKSLVRRMGRFGGSGAANAVAGEAVPNADALTSSMKSFTKGTKEYEERKIAMMKLLELLRERRSRKFGGGEKMKPKGVLLAKGNFPFQIDVRPRSFLEKQLEVLPVVKKYFRMKPEEEQVLDASLSLIYGLKYGVYNVRDQPLPEERKSLLKDWLDLLAISLPPEWGIHTTIEELRTNIDLIAQHDSNLDKILDKSNLLSQPWSKSCSKGKPSSGFSCGFWKLIHIMTVGVAEHRGGLNLIETEVVGPSTRVFSPMEAADVWRNYMEQFYMCKECRDEFLTRYDSCMFGRCERLTDNADTAETADWKELANYAWEFHNAVNLRVAEKRAKKAAKEEGYETAKSGRKRKNEVTALFPTIEQCFACFKEDGGWNHDAVFLFLEKTYWSAGSVVDPKIARFLRYDKMNYYRTSQFQSLWWMTMAALAIFVTMRRQINKAGISRTIIAANSIISRHGFARAVGGEKLRSN